MFNPPASNTKFLTVPLIAGKPASGSGTLDYQTAPCRRPFNALATPMLPIVDARMIAEAQIGSTLKVRQTSMEQIASTTPATTVIIQMGASASHFIASTLPAIAATT